MSTVIRPPEAATPIFRNGFATTALALGIVGVGFGLTVLFGLLATVFGALAVLFGVVGVVRARKGRATDGGHPHIGNNQIEVAHLRPCNRFGTIERRCHTIAIGGQNFANERDNRFFIIDHQNLRFRRPCGAHRIFRFLHHAL